MMKNISKTAATLLLLCLSFLLLTSCKLDSCIIVEYDTYTIEKKDGVYSLHFKNDPESPADPIKESASGGYSNPHFSSVTEMKEFVLSGQLSETQLYALKIGALYNKNDDGSLKLCNLDALYDVRLPENVDIEEVIWKGFCYDFDFESDDGPYGYIGYCDEYSYDREYQDHYVNIMEGQYGGSEWQVEERNATVTRHSNTTGSYTTIRYKIESGEWTVHVRELHKGGYWEESTPVHIYLFGNNGTEYFDGWIAGFTERPSVQWLSSFGLTPYVEDASAEAS